MGKTYQVEKRKPSHIKPIFYLILQIIAVIELFALINGTFNIRTWNITEIIISAILITYFSMRTHTIIKRTQHFSTEWDEKVQMEKYLDTTS